MPIIKIFAIGAVLLIASMLLVSCAGNKKHTGHQEHGSDGEDFDNWHNSSTLRSNASAAG